MQQKTWAHPRKNLNQGKVKSKIYALKPYHLCLVSFHYCFGIYVCTSKFNQLFDVHQQVYVESTLY